MRRARTAYIWPKPASYNVPCVNMATPSTNVIGTESLGLLESESTESTNIEGRSDSISSSCQQPVISLLPQQLQEDAKQH